MSCYKTIRSGLPHETHRSSCTWNKKFNKRNWKYNQVKTLVYHITIFGH